MAADMQGGPAQPVQSSNQPPDAGPAIPVAVLTEVEANARGIIAGPYRAVVEVADNRPRMAGAAIPVVLGTGSGFAQAGAPMPVYVVSGSLTPIPANVRTIVGGAYRTTSAGDYRTYIP